MSEFELGVPLRENDKLSGIATRRRSRIYWGRKQNALTPMTLSDEARGTRDWCDQNFNGLPNSAAVTFTGIGYGNDCCVAGHPEYVANPRNVGVNGEWLFDFSALNGSHILVYGNRWQFPGDIVMCGYAKLPFILDTNPDLAGLKHKVAVGVGLLFWPVLEIWQILVGWTELFDGYTDDDVNFVWSTQPQLGYMMFASYPYLDGLFPSPDGTYTRSDGWNWILGSGATVSV